MISNNEDKPGRGHVTNLTSFETPTLEMIAKRRLQLWAMTLILLISSVGVLSLVLFWGNSELSFFAARGIVYLGVVVLVVLFGAYAIGKEFDLRALTEELMDERVLAAALTNSLREANALIESGSDSKIRLNVEQVLDTILNCSMDLLDGHSGSIMLMHSEKELRTACSSGDRPARGARVELSKGIAGQVAATREPVLVVGIFDWDHYEAEEHRPASAICVPLIAGDNLIGVLSINAKTDRKYTERDLRAMSLFGEQAGAAIESARAHEAKRKVVDQGNYQAMHDPLTGLPNKALLLDRVGNSLARRRPPGHAAVLMFLDLDDFKRVNDSLGHAAGDEVLVALAERLVKSVRSGDSVAHFGGDEFAILLEAKDPEEATAAAKRILGDLAKPFPLEGREVKFTASVGIAMAHTNEMAPAELMRNAFTALHTAKQRGRAEIAIFEESMHSSALSRLDLEQELRHAVENQGLDVYFQPLMNLSNLTVHGFEALVRWIHPEKGIISAFHFIPLAEDAGLTPKIDRMVLRRTCAKVRELNRTIFADRPAAAHVNLSPTSIRQTDFVKNLASDLAESGLNPEHLVLEITEGVMMQDVEQAASRLRAIKSLGVRLALDDFGTGYSSLSYLRSFPVDVVKIDKLFVDEIETDEGASALVQAILRLGLGLTFDVVAEGIETQEQLKSLLNLGCLYGQGYYLAHPLSSPDLAEFLEKLHPATSSEKAPW
jgi:diguanylate cyclase (GGDEF)-like protein